MIKCMHCEHVTGWGDDEGCSVDACDKGGRNEKQLERWRTEHRILVFNRFCPVIQKNCHQHLGEGQYDTCMYVMIDTAVIRACPIEDQTERKRLTALRRKTTNLQDYDYDSDRKTIEELYPEKPEGREDMNCGECSWGTEHPEHGHLCRKVMMWAKDARCCPVFNKAEEDRLNTMRHKKNRTNQKSDRKEMEE